MMVPFAAWTIYLIPLIDLEFYPSGMGRQHVLILIGIRAVFIDYFIKIDLVVHCFRFTLY